MRGESGYMAALSEPAFYADLAQRERLGHDLDAEAEAEDALRAAVTIRNGDGQIITEDQDRAERDAWNRAHPNDGYWPTDDSEDGERS